MAVQDLRFVRWLIALAKNSPWLFIAAGLHLILAAVMSVMYVKHEMQKANETATEIAVSTRRDEAPQEIVQPPEELDRKKIPENEVQSELVTYEEETTFVPTEDEVPEDLYQDIGDPTGADDGSEAFTGGTAIGVGSGGHYGTGTPSAFASRRAATSNKSKKGRPPKGATVGTEEAVLEGLRWLIRHQNDDGSWGASTLAQHCDPAHPCIAPDAALDSSYDEGMTALALLAFLGQGISVGSKIEIVDTAMGKRHQAGEVVKKGIRWLMERQLEDGSFKDSRAFEQPENLTLSTMALCEAYGISKNRELKRPAQKALDYLIGAQKANPAGELWGWGLGSRRDLDEKHARGELDDATWVEQGQDVNLSITCWVVMALNSARVCQLEVPDDVLQGALAYGRSAATADALGQKAARAAEERFDYHTGRDAALGILIRTFVEKDLEDPYLGQAAEHIAGDVPRVSKDGLSVDFYYWYFATLALNQFDGPDSPRRGAGEFWEPWNEGLIESLIPLQDASKARDACSRGGWLAEARGNSRGRALYNTALNVLTLEVYYRYENVFGSAARDSSRRGG